MVQQTDEWRADAPRPDIVVTGNSVMDLLYRVRSLPKWSGAVPASDVTVLPGGKGFNQALAAARLGARVHLLSAAGQDQWGMRLKESLADEGVDVSHFMLREGAPTSPVAVLVGPGGETAFVGWKQPPPLQLRDTDIEVARPVVSGADILMATLEIRPAALLQLFQIAAESGVTVMLNPGPTPDLADLPEVGKLLPYVDVLVPNREEASLLAHGAGLGEPSGAEELAAALHGTGIPVVCVTDAGSGCAVASAEGTFRSPGFPSRVRDATGASDAFCSALAVSRAAGAGLRAAAAYANAAGALTVRTVGSSSALPDDRDIQRVLSASTSEPLTQRPGTPDE
ncbi:PfkB family carbohydrate kinase [Streptomyces lomondensis]|uniref:Ribokinase n=1 Tax=Streptomyces lomondensis TaxID=68229 RepID=A0ABQ2X207_9ACTN|nr:PfkB family carbohydrate kinase [Streptomyces lomondensis]MCF0082284.1 PfkB family carbohydrate kinase [Streptomyces lomondensis]GGW93595.1 ribokinase [Streptomyces lomondensis]